VHSHEVGRLSKFPFMSRGSILLCGIFFAVGSATRRTCSACLDWVVRAPPVGNFVSERKRSYGSPLHQRSHSQLVCAPATSATAADAITASSHGDKRLPISQAEARP